MSQLGFIIALLFLATAPTRALADDEGRLHPGQDQGFSGFAISPSADNERPTGAARTIYVQTRQRAATPQEARAALSQRGVFATAHVAFRGAISSARQSRSARSGFATNLPIQNRALASVSAGQRQDRGYAGGGSLTPGGRTGLNSYYAGVLAAARQARAQAAVAQVAPKVIQFVTASTVSLPAALTAGLDLAATASDKKSALRDLSAYATLPKSADGFVYTSSGNVNGSGGGAPAAGGAAGGGSSSGSGGGGSGSASDSGSGPHGNQGGAGGPGGAGGDSGGGDKPGGDKPGGKDSFDYSKPLTQEDRDKFKAKVEELEKSRQPGGKFDMSAALAVTGDRRVLNSLQPGRKLGDRESIDLSYRMFRALGNDAGGGTRVIKVGEVEIRLPADATDAQKKEILERYDTIRAANPTWEIGSDMITQIRAEVKKNDEKAAADAKAASTNGTNASTNGTNTSTTAR